MVNLLLVRLAAVDSEKQTMKRMVLEIGHRSYCHCTDTKREGKFRPVKWMPQYYMLHAPDDVSFP